MVLLLAFVCGCSSDYYPSSSYQDTYSNNVRQREYYIKQAWQAIDAFRVTEQKECYGFMLGTELENWDVHKYTIDEKTGGRVYRLPDVKGVFDVIGVHTDNDGTILSIIAIKDLDDYNKQMELFKIIKEQLGRTYPTYQLFTPGRYDGAAVRTITIKSAENDSDWVEKFAWYVEQQDTGHPFTCFKGFAWMLHPTLAEIKCVVIGRMGDGGVTLTYTGKEYIRMEHLHNNLLKEKLKGL